MSSAFYNNIHELFISFTLFSSEQEVALVNNGLLPVYTHEGPSPVLQYSPMDTYSTSIQPQPPTPPISSVSTRLYPALLEECDEREEIHNYEETDLVTPVRVPNSHPLETRTQSDINLNRVCTMLYNK